MKFSKILFVLILSAAALSIGSYASTVHAQDIMSGLKQTASAAGLPGKPSGGIEDAIGKVIGSVMGLVGTLLFVYMLYGGLKWMMAGGDNKAVTEATAIIRNAIIGIVIIVFAYVLANYVITTLSSVASSASQTPSGTQAATCPASYSCMTPDAINSKMECPSPMGANGCSASQACCKINP
ncbi:MAG: pilin [Patescibacteria group bacterium]|nr:pilin [Patescibacteria group bacterium]